MTVISSAAQTALTEMEIEFPNLFGGTAINYYRGFQVFGVNIYWYGVLIAVGVVLAYLYAMWRATKDFGLVKDRVFDVVFAAIIGGFLCARIYFCVFTTLDPNSSVKYDFITMFTTIRDGGLAIYGGVIGAFIVGFVFCKIRKVNFFAMADLASLGFLIGQTIGRWGNFINQEAYGEICSPDWIFGMSGTKIIDDPDIGAGALVHPCFLYESAWCLLGFVLLHFYSKKLRTFDGEILLMYISWYGLGRFFIEGLRTDSLYAGSLRVSQAVAAVSFVVAMILFIIFKIVTAKKGIPLYVNSDGSRELIERDLAADEERKQKKLAKKASREKSAPSILGEGVEMDDAEDETASLTDTETEDEIPEIPEEPFIPEESVINEENNESDNKED